MFEGIGLIGAYTAQQELKLEAKFKVGHMYIVILLYWSE